MGRLSGFTYSGVVRKVKTLRFEVDRDIPERTLHAILRAARVTPEEFLAA